MFLTSEAPRYTSLHPPLVKGGVRQLADGGFKIYNNSLKFPFVRPACRVGKGEEAFPTQSISLRFSVKVSKRVGVNTVIDFR